MTKYNYLNELGEKLNYLKELEQQYINSETQKDLIILDRMLSIINRIEIDLNNKDLKGNDKLLILEHNGEILVELANLINE